MQNVFESAPEFDFEEELILLLEEWLALSSSINMEEWWGDPQLREVMQIARRVENFLGGVVSMSENELKDAAEKLRWGIRMLSEKVV